MKLGVCCVVVLNLVLAETALAEEVARPTQAEIAAYGIDTRSTIAAVITFRVVAASSHGRLSVTTGRPNSFSVLLDDPPRQAAFPQHLQFRVP